MFSAAFSGSGKLIGTQDNIMVCDVNKSSPELVSVIEGFDYSSVTAIQPVNEELVSHRDWQMVFSDYSDRCRIGIVRFPDKDCIIFGKSLLMADDQSIWCRPLRQEQLSCYSSLIMVH